MIEEILDSEAKVKIMKFLSRFPDDQFQAIEIARRAELSVSRTSECLKELANKGILESQKLGKGYLFRVNRFNYISKIILEVFEKEQRLVEIIAKDFVSRVKRLDRIKAVVLFGSALKELKIGSDVDFLVISEYEISRSAVSAIGAEMTQKYGFPISSAVMTTKELTKKAKRGEGFVRDVIATGKVVFGKSLEEIVYGKRG